MDKIKVVATKDGFWYKKDKIIEVENRVVWHRKPFGKPEACFCVKEGYYYIPIENCAVLTEEEVKESELLTLKTENEELKLENEKLRRKNFILKNLNTK